LEYLKTLIPYPCRFYQCAKKLASQASKFIDEGTRGEFKPDEKLLKNGMSVGLSAKELLDSNVAILKGVTEDESNALKKLKCGTVKRLATYSFGHWAEVIVALAPLDEQYSAIAKKC
jgi:hypothetical protein